MPDANAIPGLSVIIPTFNESQNITELVRRLDTAVAADPLLASMLSPVSGNSAGNDSAARIEVIVVDDSDDDTPQQVSRAAETARLQISCIHRPLGARTGGLGGAVLVGTREARHDLCLVMDGDLQHPPERIGALYARAIRGDVDVVIASRYAGGSDRSGLAGALRHGVSRASTLLVKAMFPILLHDCSDPMTGFFLFDRRRVDLDRLKPQGFKILLEMLARQRLAIAEIPFSFAERHAGNSKASARQGMHFLRQLMQLRFGRMSGFALIGATGALVNIGLVWLLTHLGMGVGAAALSAAEITIVGNFLLQDRFVFGDLRAGAPSFWRRFLRSFLFNNVESLIRIFLVVRIVDLGLMSATVATAVLLALAFILRYVFHALVVYAPTRARARDVGGTP